MRPSARSIQLRWVSVFLAAFTFLGCKEMKVHNGQIPEKYRAMAIQYTGSYPGVMGQIPGQLRISLQGNRVVAEFWSEKGNDLLDPRCQSQIGDLLKVKVSERDGVPQLETATFAFNPNNCWQTVEGRELVLRFTGRADGYRLNASILVNSTVRSDCRIDTGNPAAGVAPSEICGNKPIGNYLTGRFFGAGAGSRSEGTDVRPIDLN